MSNAARGTADSLSAHSFWSRVRGIGLTHPVTSTQFVLVLVSIVKCSLAAVRGVNVDKYSTRDWQSECRWYRAEGGLEIRG